MTAIFYTLLFPLMLLFTSCQSATDKQQANQTDSDSAALQDTTGMAKATFAGGCFWCTEVYFERLKGVEAVISGYAGGEEQNPTYRQVSYGETGHAEGVQVYYDPQQITFKQLLEVFFATHDPTTLNRQGPDVGEQYRSVVFFNNPEEKRVTEEYIANLLKSGKYKNKIVTEVQPLQKFWEAEKYHQNYYVNNPSDPYVRSVAKPKVDKFTKEYKDWLKEEWKK
jgi:peptide-methionine (S)-S-oxide reductase